MTTSKSPPVTAMDRVYVHVRDHILAGDFKPGQHLGEAALATLLDVSRTPVREALRKLAADGYVDLRTHAGAAVRLWDPAEIRSSFAVRADIEGRAAMKAAERITPVQLAELEGLCARIEATNEAQGEQSSTRSELNRQMHVLILRISGLAHAEKIAMQLMDVAVLAVTFSQFSAEQAARSDSDHRLLMTAFRQRDGELAQAVMRAHILAAAAVLDERKAAETR